jgi:hypothetical protein
MTNNNMWDCADMPPMFSAKWNMDDSSVFLHCFFVNFWYSTVSIEIHTGRGKKLKENYLNFSFLISYILCSS